MNKLALCPKSQPRLQSVSKLKFNNRKKIPLHRLPFVGSVSGKPRLSFWTVPRAGGYVGGCKTGEALALIYLKHLIDHADPLGCGQLQWIVGDMVNMPQYSSHQTAEMSALRGQIVGFFSTLDPFLRGAAVHLNHGLQNVEFNDLLNRANQGLDWREPEDNAPAGGDA
ncbi:MAG: hypothetical protein ACRBBM_11010 [Pseudomonadaceae bacterium]|jgi:hypothetical protein